MNGNCVKGVDKDGANAAKSKLVNEAYSMLAVPPPYPELIITPAVVCLFSDRMYGIGSLFRLRLGTRVGSAKLSLKFKIIVCLAKSFALVLFSFFWPQQRTRF